MPQFFWRAASGGGGTVIPAIIQQISSSTNPVGLGLTADDFIFQLPQDVGAHNLLELALVYPNGNTPTITDNNGNTWPAASASADPGAGGFVLAVFDLKNANAGTTKITAHFGAQIQPVAYWLTELAGIDTTSPVNGTASTGAGPVTGPNLTTGSFTPGNNNANGGNMVMSYFALASAAGGNPSKFTAGAGFALRDADITWINNVGFPKASQSQLQATSSSINPSMTAVAGTGSACAYNGVAVALKAASAGTAKPAGIHIDRISHFSGFDAGTAASGTLKIQCSATGNCRLIANAAGTSQITFSGVTDSDGNTYMLRQAAADNPYFWEADNTSPSSDFTISMVYTGKAAAGMSLRYFDVSQAATSPFDGVFGFGPSGAVSGVSTINNAPTGAPGTNVKGLCIVSFGLGLGPVTGFNTGAPAGAVMDNVLDTDGVNPDNDQMDNADGVAHVFYSTNATLNWNWTIRNVASNTGYATAICLKSA